MQLFIANKEPRPAWWKVIQFALNDPLLLVITFWPTPGAFCKIKAYALLSDLSKFKAAIEGSISIQFNLCIGHKLLLHSKTSEFAEVSSKDSPFRYLIVWFKDNKISNRFVKN